MAISTSPSTIISPEDPAAYQALLLNQTGSTVNTGVFNTTTAATSTVNLGTATGGTTNVSINTTANRSVVLAGITTTTTSAAILDSVNIYNTDKEIYVTGIDQGTTQQYIYNTTGAELLPATIARLGGVIIGSGITVNDAGVISTTLPTASATTLGGVRVGSGLSVNSSTGALSVDLPQASAAALGGVKVGSGLAIDSTTGVLSSVIPQATTSILGGVKVDGTSIVINSATGVISATGGGGGSGYVLPVAGDGSSGNLGGIKVGSNLTIDSSGLLSAPAPNTYSFNSETLGPEGAVLVVEEQPSGSLQLIKFNAGDGIAIANADALPEFTFFNTGVTKVTAGTGISISSSNNDGTGELIISSTGGSGVDTNTLYAISATTVTNGASLTLSGTDSTVDSVKFIGGSNVTVTRTDVDTITISSSSGSGGGLTSVGVTSTDLTVSNSPLTANGNINLVLNTVSPAKGGTGQTSFNTGDMLYASNASTLTKRAIGTTGQVLTVDSGGIPVWRDPAAGGTVSSVSVTTANGFKGTVATDTTTPAISIGTTVTGLLKGNGTAVSAAVAGTDFQGPITLTTTGTSGPATFSNNTLNIPQYAASSGVAGVSSIIAGSGITISPAGGTGDVTISAAAGSGGDGTYGFRAAQGAPNSGDTSNRGYAFGGDGDTGLFSPGSGNNNGVVSIYNNNTESVRIDSSYNLTMQGGGYIQTTTLTAGSATTDGNLVGKWTVPSGSTLTLATPLAATSGGTGINTYAKGDIVYASAANTLAKLPLGTTDGHVLTVNTTTGIPEWRAAGGGAGSGITSITLATGTTGLTVNSSSTSTLTSNGTFTVGGTLSAANGGTGFATYAKGDIVYSSATNTLGKLTIGSQGQVLTVSASGIPSWSSAGTGTVTSVAISGGLTGLTTSGGPITSGSGTITLGGTLAAANGGTGQSTYAVGDILYASTTSAVSRRAIGTEGQVLTVNASGLPVWATPSGGTGGTDTNTTYSVSATTVTGGAGITLTGSDSTVDSVKLVAGSNVTITRTDADTVTIASTASGGGGTSTPEIVVLKFTSGQSGNLSGADCIVSQTSGVTATISDGTNSIVNYTFTGKSNPPKSIVSYAQICATDTTQQKFAIKDTTSYTTAVVLGGTSLASPQFITNIASNTFNSTIQLQTQIGSTYTGAVAGFGQRAYLVLVFGF